MVSECGGKRYWSDSAGDTCEWEWAEQKWRLEGRPTVVSRYQSEPCSKLIRSCSDYYDQHVLPPYGSQSWLGNSWIGLEAQPYTTNADMCTGDDEMCGYEVLLARGED